MSESRFTGRIGRIVNAYVDSIVKRASGDPAYDPEQHAQASLAFDDMLADLDEASRMIGYLDDWISGTDGLVIAVARDPDGVRCDTETVNGVTRSRLWVNETGDKRHESFRDALRDDMRTNYRDPFSAGRARSEESDNG